MWAQFTERAKRAVAFAQEEAGRRGDSFVGPEDLLLGTVRQADAPAARALAGIGISVEEVRAEIERRISPPTAARTQEMQLTPRGKKVIDLACDEARLYQCRFIGTEHLLLGVIREGKSLAARVLIARGGDLDRARAAVQALLDEPPEVSPDGASGGRGDEVSASSAEAGADRLLARAESDREVAAIRGEIQRSGVVVEELRSLIPFVVAVIGGVIWVIGGVLWQSFGVGLLGFLIGFVVAPLYRAWRVRRLRAWLAPLSPRRQAEILGPMPPVTEREGARIVASLLRSLKVPAELTRWPGSRLATDDQLASLQADIGSAAEASRRIRVGFLGGVVGVVLGGATWLALRVGYVRPDWMAYVLLLFGALSASLATPFAIGLAWMYRTRKRDELARALSQLPAEQRAKVLLPLRDARHGDTRKIVLPLLRDLGIPAEVAPAAEPAGRGDEVAEG